MPFLVPEKADCWISGWGAMARTVSLCAAAQSLTPGPFQSQYNIMITITRILIGLIQSPKVRPTDLPPCARGSTAPCKWS